MERRTDLRPWLTEGSHGGKAKKADLQARVNRPGPANKLELWKRTTTYIYMNYWERKRANDNWNAEKGRTDPRFWFLNSFESCTSTWGFHSIGPFHSRSLTVDLVHSTIDHVLLAIDLVQLIIDCGSRNSSSLIDGGRSLSTYQPIDLSSAPTSPSHSPLQSFLLASRQERFSILAWGKPTTIDWLATRKERSRAIK